jgi:hypothetical protein
VETVEYKKLVFTVWDVGGCDKVSIFLHLNISNFLLILEKD